MPEETTDEDFTGAQIYCPVCCTVDDAESWGVNEMECNNCGTSYSVDIKPQIVAEYAMVG